MKILLFYTHICDQATAPSLRCGGFRVTDFCHSGSNTFLCHRSCIQENRAAGCHPLHASTTNADRQMEVLQPTDSQDVNLVWCKGLRLGPAASVCATSGRVRAAISPALLSCQCAPQFAGLPVTPVLLTSTGLPGFTSLSLPVQWKSVFCWIGLGKDLQVANSDMLLMMPSVCAMIYFDRRLQQLPNMYAFSCPWTLNRFSSNDKELCVGHDKSYHMETDLILEASCYRLCAGSSTLIMLPSDYYD